MPKKVIASGGQVEAKPEIIGDDAHELILPRDKAEETAKILCKAAEALTITNGNKLLYHGKGVESITINFRGD